MHKDATLLNAVEGQSVHSLRSKAVQAELDGPRRSQQLGEKRRSMYQSKSYTYVYFIYLFVDPSIYL